MDPQIKLNRFYFIPCEKRYSLFTECIYMCR